MISANVDRFYSGSYEVLERSSLNYFDPKVNSNKFYIAEIHYNNLEYRLYINYGRQGKNGVENSEAHGTLASVEKAYRNKVNSKIKKGYVEVELATFNKGSEKGQNILNESAVGKIAVDTKSKKKSKLKSEIIKLVKHLYDEANQAIKMSISGKVNSDISAPLGNLGYGGIDKGRDILKRISRAIDNGDKYEMEHYSVEYYRFVPRNLGSDVRDTSLWLIDTQDKVQRELDTLDLYEDTLRMLPVMVDTDIDERYKALNCDIEYIGEGETLDYIRHKVTSTIAYNHNFKLEVVNAYEVNQKNAPKFDDSCGNVVKLFHGSRSANLVGILSSHLRLPKYLPNNLKTGAMFGPGIYTASDSSKSFNYSSGMWNGKRNKHDTAFLFICEVALGNVYEVDSAQNFSKAPAGYNSVKGCKGRNLYNNEFIVYNENQIKIKYLVECRKI